MEIRIGFVGLGNMGAAMALLIAHSDYELRVWNRSDGKAQALIAAGAIEMGSVEEVFENSDIVLSMLSNDAAVDGTFSADALRKGSGVLHVNMATISIDMCRSLSTRHLEHGVDYIAAPVLGRSEVAAEGQLSIIAAGRDELINRAEPILNLLGKRIWRIGEDPAQANLVKIGLNYNLIHALQALGESLSLVEHGGVNSQTFVDILTDAVFTGSAYTVYGRLIAQREYRPAGFTVGLGLKDLGLATTAARQLGAELPTAETIREIFEKASQDPELNDGDWSIIAEVIRRGGSGTVTF